MMKAQFCFLFCAWKPVLTLLYIYELIYTHILWVFHGTQKVLCDGKICSFYVLTLKYVLANFLFL